MSDPFAAAMRRHRSIVPNFVPAEWVADPRTPQEHSCGHCMTPWGKSALPCRNAPDA